MRNLTLIALFSFIWLNALAQHNENENMIDDTIPKIDGNYQYQQIVNLDSSYKKDDLYRNAKLFIFHNFKSAKDVIQYNDKEQGIVIGKGVL